MKKVKVIMNDGKILEVKYGYANYLIKMGLAQIYSDAKMKEIEYQKKVLLEKQERQKKKALELKSKLEKEKISFLVKVGEDDRMYGSITNKDIAEKLKEKGYDIDRKSILLEEPIRAIGSYTIPIKLHPEVIAEIKVKVEKE
ncbi:MAG: 50S ribosomal protein L9 [Candidatus Hydrothermia bacterium]|jgi:large subunit ribosomal protein L9|nr:50S ribosomal protein L9 [Candidatus Hydrothermia bacterium]